MTSEARFFVNLLTIGSVLAVLGGVWAFAFFKGRKPERWGVTLYALGSLAMVGFESLAGSIPAVPTLLLDTGMAMAFLVLAVCYNSLWLGFAMILQGLVLGLHAMHLTGEETGGHGSIDFYALGIDLISVGILVTFGLGTWASIRERKRKRLRLAAEGTQSTVVAFAEPSPAN